MHLDFIDNKIITFDEEVPAKFSSSGYYCITIGEMIHSNKKIAV